MFVAKEEETLSEAQGGGLYAPQHPFSQRVPLSNGIARNHLEHDFKA